MLDKLTAKIGPLPAWAWGVILGGLILVYMWWTRSRANKAATGTTTATATPDVSGTGLSPAPTPADTPTDTSWATNQTWEAKAIAFLRNSGTSPLTAQIAIEKYLNGQTLTAKEGLIIDAILAALGPPPNGTAGIPNVTPAPTPAPTPTPSDPGATKKPKPVRAPAPTPAPPKQRTYVVKKGDTLSAISLRFYGHSNPALWAKIANANHISNVNLIRAGQTLVIPA